MDETWLEFLTRGPVAVVLIVVILYFFWKDRLLVRDIVERLIVLIDKLTSRKDE